MVNEKVARHGSYHVCWQMFRLTLVQRDFVTLVQKYFKVVDYPITFTS
jgi:hypothetical protein